MEVLWYWLMPCLDEIENFSVHDLGTHRGEAALTVSLQVGLAISLLFGGLLYDTFGAAVVLLCLAGLQLFPPIIFGLARGYSRASRKMQIAKVPDELTSGTTSATESKQTADLSILLIVLGITSAIPQLVNIVFPLKVFSITDQSFIAGTIDAMYNVGALLIAIVGLASFMHRGSVRFAVAISLVLAAASMLIFATVESVSILGVCYLVLGFVATYARVRTRAEVFSRLKGLGSSVWYSRITNVTLICCTGGAICIGVIGFYSSTVIAYVVIALLSASGAVFSLFIRPDVTERQLGIG